MLQPLGSRPLTTSGLRNYLKKNLTLFFPEMKILAHIYKMSIWETLNGAEEDPQTWLLVTDVVDDKMKSQRGQNLLRRA